MIDPTLLKPILTRTRELVAQGWCQHDFAQNELSRSVYIDSERACRWCLDGALYLATHEQHVRAAFPLVSCYLGQFIQGPHLPHPISRLADYNDAPTTTQQDVLALLDRAMAEVGT